MQRAADLAAVSAARSMRDDFERLFEPPCRRPANPRHLEKAPIWSARGPPAWRWTRPTELDSTPTVASPTGAASRPSACASQVRGKLTVRPTRVPSERARKRRSSPPPGDGAPRRPGGGYAARSPTARASRCGPTWRARSTAWSRPPAATASSSSSRPATAPTPSRRSCTRAPGPEVGCAARQVAAPLGTELDLGPPSAYGWLARNAGRFHFLQRYSWEPWHYGYTLNPRSTPDVCGEPAARRRRTAMPSFVPAGFRDR